MSYITPNSIIRLLKNVPLDNTYRHTIYFASKSDQISYFIGLVKHSLTSQSYQRVNKGTMRVNVSADSAYDCNYLMFQNTAFGTKYFYAFIKSVEYINNVTCEIEFEIDVMQTWMFDYTLTKSFIERKHTPTDNIGDWVQPENVDLGVYIDSHEQETNLFNSYSVVIITADVSESDPPNGMIGGLYSGCRYITALVNTESQVEVLNNYLVALVKANNQDAIVSILYVPTAIVPTEAGSPKHYTAEYPPHISDIDGYVPRNKKLLTYPYNFMYVSNNEGDGVIYRYERCNKTENGNILCGIFTQFSANPEIAFMVYGYNGEVLDYDDALFIKSFPQCCFSYDTFRAWVAQGGVLKTTISGAGVVGSAISGNAMGAVLGTSNMVNDVVNASLKPNTLIGQAGGSFNAANKFQDFRITQRHILPSFAKIIDDYFDKYGYAYNQYGTVDRSTRPHWNYIKTRDVTITGSVPVDDMRKICQVYDNGITFWKNGSEVGDYSLDNSV